MDIAPYLGEVTAKFRSGPATGHSYRPAAQRLFESIDPALTIIDEPRKSDAGCPISCSSAGLDHWRNMPLETGYDETCRCYRRPREPVVVEDEKRQAGRFYTQLVDIENELVVKITRFVPTGGVA